MHKLSLEALRVKYENEPDALNALGVSTASQIIVDIPVTRSHVTSWETCFFCNMAESRRNPTHIVSTDKVSKKLYEVVNKCDNVVWKWELSGCVVPTDGCTNDICYHIAWNGHNHNHRWRNNLISKTFLCKDGSVVACLTCSSWIICWFNRSNITWNVILWHWVISESHEQSCAIRSER